MKFKKLHLFCTLARHDLLGRRCGGAGNPLNGIACKWGSVLFLGLLLVVQATPMFGTQHNATLLGAEATLGTTGCDYNLPLFVDAQNHFVRHPKVNPFKLPRKDGIDKNNLPDRASKADMMGIYRQARAHRYRPRKNGEDGHTASNAANGPNVRYGANGQTHFTRQDGEPFHLDFRPIGVSHEDPQALSAPEEVATGGAVVTYYPNEIIREWWVNSPDGLEQWFKINEAPWLRQDKYPLQVMEEDGSGTDMDQAHNNSAIAAFRRHITC